MANFEPIVEWVLFQEDDKKEPGKIVNLGDGAGLTRLGITQHYHAKDVPLNFFIDMPFNQAVTWAKIVYKKFYWNPINGDLINSDSVAAPVFSLAVNDNPGLAARLLQKVLGVVEDGVIGPKTLAELASKDPNIVAKFFRAEWEDLYQRIVSDGKHDDQDKRFLSGWLNRVHYPYPSAIPEIYVS